MGGWEPAHHRVRMPSVNLGCVEAALGGLASVFLLTCCRFWGENQPNSLDGRNQDCVEFWHHASGNGDWNDEHCNVDNNWMCEM